MRELVKTGALLAAIFATTFIVLKLTGVLTLEDIHDLFKNVSTLPPAYIVVLVILLLFADLFIAIPTMTVSILAGYFLGAPLGALAVTLGMMSSGLCGYGLSRRLGPRILERVYSDRARLADMERTFAKNGVAVLMTCRAMPILPEVSCCLAGATRMPFGRFLGAFTVGTIPYAIITTYAGSISSPQSPMPAILTAGIVSAALWLSWVGLIRRTSSS